jgi:hypothetical protein
MQDRAADFAITGASEPLFVVICRGWHWMRV